MQAPLAVCFVENAGLEVAADVGSLGGRMQYAVVGSWVRRAQGYSCRLGGCQSRANLLLNV
jgi:hypothetical protein